MIEGVLQMFSDKSNVMRRQAEQLLQDNIRYSDYALSTYSRQDVEAASYACVKVGVGEWIVRCIGINTRTSLIESSQ